MSKSPEQLRSLGIFGSRTAHLDNRGISEAEPQEINEGLQVGDIVKPTPKYLQRIQAYTNAPVDGVVVQLWGDNNLMVQWNNYDFSIAVRAISVKPTGKKANSSLVKRLVKKLKHDQSIPGKKEAGEKPPKGAKVSKGIYYFKDYKVAEEWAKGNGWPTDRILHYQKGYAIQSGRSGNYAGPGEKPKKFGKQEAGSISFKSMLQKIGFTPSDSTYKFHGKVVKFLNKLKDDRNRKLLAKMWNNLRKSEGKKESLTEAELPRPNKVDSAAWADRKGDISTAVNLLQSKLGWKLVKLDPKNPFYDYFTWKTKEGWPLTLGLGNFDSSTAAKGVIRYWKVIASSIERMKKDADPFSSDLYRLIKKGIKSNRETRRLAYSISHRILTRHFKVRLNSKGFLQTLDSLAGDASNLTEAEIQAITEGLYDPYILKAVFMAGGPGSGKGFYRNKLFAGTGLKVVNSDDQFERFMKQAGLDMRTQVGSPKAQAMRPQAKAVTKMKMNSLANSRLGVVVDGTARNPSKVLRMKEKLEKIGYDTSLVMINTSLDVAKKRNKMRDRTVPENIVVDSWAEVQEAAKKYRTAFGKNFHEIDGNTVFSDKDVKSKLIPKMNNLGIKILKEKLSNPRGWGWLVKTATELGITDPRKVTHLGKVGMSKAKALAGSKAESLTEATRPKIGDVVKLSPGLAYSLFGQKVFAKGVLLDVVSDGRMAKVVLDIDQKVHTVNMGNLSSTGKVADRGTVMMLKKRYKKQLANKSKAESLNESELVHIPEGGDVKGRERKSSKVGYIVKDNVFQPVGPIEKAATLEPGIYEIQSSLSGPYFEVTSVTTDKLLRFKDSRYNETLNEISKFWKLKEKYAEMGFPHKRGVLLYGPPGTGKSCLLKMVIEEMVSGGNIVLKTRSPGTLMSGLKALREIEKDRKVLCILEDVDELCRYNEHSILQLFDGDSTVDNVCYLATTNYIERLPPRILRSGRFDRKVKVVAPPKEGRMAYYQAKLGLNENGNELKEIVDLTDGFTFAEMKEFLVSTYILDIPAKTAAHRIRTGLEESVHSPEAMTEMVEGLAMKKVKR